VVVKWDDDDDVGEESILGLCLVGKVWTVRRLNANAFMSTMEKIWNPNHGMEAKEIDTSLFLFQFYHWKDQERVLEGEPWAFDKNVVVLRQIAKGIQPSQMADLLTHARFLVRIYDPLLDGRKDKNIQALANSLGAFIKIDDQCIKGWTKSLRFKTPTDLHEPFLDEVSLEHSDGRTISLPVKYEKLSNFCYFCG